MDHIVGVFALVEEELERRQARSESGGIKRLVRSKGTLIAMLKCLDFMWNIKKVLEGLYEGISHDHIFTSLCRSSEGD